MQGAQDKAAADFALGRGLQAQGDIGPAAAAYRRLGARIRDFLVQDGAAGDRVFGPHFLIIGPGRAGTTWFKRRLAHHPQVFMLPGEPNYFSSTYESPAEAYVGRFAAPDEHFKRPATAIRRAVGAFDRLYGEKSPSYLAMGDDGIDLCAALFPEVRLICTVREPVSRAWSHLKHMEPRQLHKVLDAVARGAPSAALDEVIRQGRYAEHLARWARRFRPGQILLVDFARLASEPAAVFQDTLRHIGAQTLPDKLDLGRVGRPTVEMEMPPELAARLETAYASERFDVAWLKQVLERGATEATPSL